MQTVPETVAAAVHSGVAALAAPVAAALTPPTIASVATAASTLLLIDSTWRDDEVMTDLLSEDLRLWLMTAPSLLGSSARRARVGHWSNSLACLLRPWSRQHAQFAPWAVATPVVHWPPPSFAGGAARANAQLSNAQAFGGRPEAAEASALHLSHRGASFAKGGIPLKERRTPASIGRNVVAYDSAIEARSGMSTM